jgi:hypothetical protein
LNIDLTLLGPLVAVTLNVSVFLQVDYIS